MKKGVRHLLHKHPTPGYSLRDPRDEKVPEPFFSNRQLRRIAHIHPWLTRCSLLSGICALAWLLLRSGTKPTRLAYPCQQAAFGTAALVLGLPVVAALLRFRQRLVAFVGTITGKAVACALAAAVGLTALASVTSQPRITWIDPPADYRPQIYLVNDARGIVPDSYGGVDDLVSLMGLRGLKLHRSAYKSLTAGPDGLIDPDDVVILKVNSQWPERGGTNTDVLRGVIRNILDHPDHFTGEIVVADNGQEFAPDSLDWQLNNSEDGDQSVKDVVNDFAVQGWPVATKRWDTIRRIPADEYDQGDLTDGYVVSDTLDPEAQFRVSYPKFQTAFGTYVSYKRGIWTSGTQQYDPDRLVVINMPVLKTHFIYGITAAVKNHMGVITTGLSTGSHAAVANGAMGSILADVGPPDLNILDCIWVLAHPGSGPAAPYVAASRRDQLVASTDPAALDVWAVRNILVPQIIANGYTTSGAYPDQDPDNPVGDFRRYLDRSVNEMLLGGISTTCAADSVDLHVWRGDHDRDGDVDLTDFSEFAPCTTGPGGGVPDGCDTWDFDSDGDIDNHDFAILQVAVTGSIPALLP